MDLDEELILNSHENLCNIKFLTEIKLNRYRKKTIASYSNENLPFKCWLK